MVNPMAIAEAWANVGKSAFGGQNAFEQGRTKMAQALADIAMRESHARAFDATAAKSQAEADSINQRRQYQTPEFSGRVAAGFAGLSDTQGSELENFQKSGNWGVNPAYADDTRQMTVAPTPKTAPEWYSPDVERRFNMGRGAHLANLGATGDTNADQMIKGFAELLNQGRINEVISDPTKAAAVGGAMAASSGKELFNQGANGVMDKFTGAETLNDVGRSAAAENNAQASNAYASAGAHNANRQKTLAEIPEVQSRIDLNRSKTGQPEITTLPDGTVVTTGKSIPWKYDAGSDEFVAPPTPEYPNGLRSGNQAKLNAAKSLDYVISQYGAALDGSPAEKGKSVLETTPQGGIMGASGLIGKVTDSQKVKRFDNLKEQLSTELRTLFRIPGEGALSDKEQAQYGIQLPSVTNDKTTNAAILRDIQARVKLRQQQSNPLTPSNGQPNKNDLLRDAKAAIAAGASRDQVIKRLKELGVDGGGI